MHFSKALSQKMCLCSNHKDSFDIDKPNHVCKLRKAIYDLKQAPHAWYHELRQFLLSSGFTNCHADTSLFLSSTTVVKPFISLFMLMISSLLIVMLELYKHLLTFSIRDSHIKIWVHYQTFLELKSLHTNIVFSYVKCNTSLIYSVALT